MNNFQHFFPFSRLFFSLKLYKFCCPHSEQIVKALFLFMALLSVSFAVHIQNKLSRLSFYSWLSYQFHLLSTFRTNCQGYLFIHGSLISFICCPHSEQIVKAIFLFMALLSVSFAVHIQNKLSRLSFYSWLSYQFHLLSTFRTNCQGYLFIHGSLISFICCPHSEQIVKAIFLFMALLSVSFAVHIQNKLSRLSFYSWLSYQFHLLSTFRTNCQGYLFIHGSLISFICCPHSEQIVKAIFLFMALLSVSFAVHIQNKLSRLSFYSWLSYQFHLLSTFRTNCQGYLFIHGSLISFICCPHSEQIVKAIFLFMALLSVSFAVHIQNKLSRLSFYSWLSYQFHLLSTFRTNCQGYLFIHGSLISFICCPHSEQIVKAIFLFMALLSVSFAVHIQNKLSRLSFYSWLSYQFHLLSTFRTNCQGYLFIHGSLISFICCPHSEQIVKAIFLFMALLSVSFAVHIQNKLSRLSFYSWLSYQFHLLSLLISSA